MTTTTANAGIRPSRRDLLAMLALAGVSGRAAPAAAETQDWPHGPGRIIVAFPAGTSTDNFARGVASQFQAQSGQPFVDENRPGAGGWPGTLYVSKSKPDGETLTVNANGISIYNLVQKNDFDATKDLTPIAMLASAPVALLVSSTVPATTLAEFIAYCKAHPNDVFFGSAGVGSINHLYGELFNQRAGITMKHVPYRGFGEALPDLVAGRIQIIFSSYATGGGLIKSGQIRLLAYSGSMRPEGTPTAPAVRDSGIDYDVSFWWALFGPGGMANDLRDRINAATNKAMQTPDMTKLFLASGVVANPMNADQFTAVVKKDYAVLKALVDSEHMTF